MSRHALHAVLAAAVLALCCGRITQKGATKESVTALLQNEAAAMKRDGEKLDPSIGVKATWTVTAVGGTHVCLRRVDPALVFDLIATF